MSEKKAGSSSSKVWLWINGIIVLALLVGAPSMLWYCMVWYSDTRGPFKNWMQVVDLDGDGNLDVLISHTRWEEVDISWAGIGRWINQGNGKFELAQDEQMDYFSAFAAGAGDADLDGDADIFVQNFNIHLLVNLGGQQEGVTGEFRKKGEFNSSLALDSSYRDMGGTILTGDLNGDGRLDALVTGCCYGLDPTEPGYDDYPHSPSLSWVWINDGKQNGRQIGHELPIDILDGTPIREAALGDVDGDGDLDVFAAVGKPTLGKSVSLSDLLLLNDGTGQLTVSDQQLGNSDSTSVALGDLNGDARLDALVGTTRGAKIWFNNDNNSPIFVPSNQAPGSASLKSVFLADLDSDGDMDALLAGLREAILWSNNGKGEFSRSNASFRYKEDSGLAVGDFDGDGDQDIFAGNNAGYYRIWFNDGNF